MLTAYSQTAFASSSMVVDPREESMKITREVRAKLDHEMDITYGDYDQLKDVLSRGHQDTVQTTVRLYLDILKNPKTGTNRDTIFFSFLALPEDPFLIDHVEDLLWDFFWPIATGQQEKDISLSYFLNTGLTKKFKFLNLLCRLFTNNQVKDDYRVRIYNALAYHHDRLSIERFPELYRIFSAKNRLAEILKFTPLSASLRWAIFEPTDAYRFCLFPFEQKIECFTAVLQDGTFSDEYRLNSLKKLSEISRQKSLQYFPFTDTTVDTLINGSQAWVNSLASLAQEFLDKKFAAFGNYFFCWQLGAKLLYRIALTNKMPTHESRRIALNLCEFYAYHDEKITKEIRQLGFDLIDKQLKKLASNASEMHLVLGSMIDKKPHTLPILFQHIPDPFINTFMQLVATHIQQTYIDKKYCLNLAYVGCGLSSKAHGNMNLAFRFVLRLLQTKELGGFPREDAMEWLAFHYKESCEKGSPAFKTYGEELIAFFEDQNLPQDLLRDFQQSLFKKLKNKLPQELRPLPEVMDQNDGQNVEG